MGERLDGSRLGNVKVGTCVLVIGIVVDETLATRIRRVVIAACRHPPLDRRPRQALRWRYRGTGLQPGARDARPHHPRRGVLRVWRTRKGRRRGDRAPRARV